MALPMFHVGPALALAMPAGLALAWAWSRRETSPPRCLACGLRPPGRNMLRQWLGPDNLDEFVANHLGRAPFARAGAAACAVPLLDWESFGAVLASDPPPDVMVAFCGRTVPVEQPRSLTAAQRLLRQGLGIVVRRSERHSSVFASIGDSFAKDIAGDVQVRLYATPAGTQTFGWHFDFEDVFVAQTVGVKDYYFRDNTVARDIERTAQLDFSAIRHETSPLYTARLVHGDWLYIPRRWWHLVRSVEDALSISVGVMAAEAAQRSSRPAVAPKPLVRADS